MNTEQIKREIQWLEIEINKLESLLPFKPRKAKQINEYKRQITDKKLRLVFSSEGNI